MMGKKLILSLGRITEKKGLDLLARAFGSIARERDDVHLVIAGPDERDYRAQVEGWLRTERVSEKTTFTGMLVGAEKQAAFRDADLFVLPSYSENFGLAVVEAMAFGLPVVVSKRVNIWREIADAGAGLVVDCDVRQLADALEQMLRDAAAAQGMGECGHRLVESRFTWSRVGQQMAAVYEDIISADRSRKFAKKLNR
jgi:glycosyltransferase involved in cell wall biosynthesis